MAKRKLTRKQAWRIEKIQQERAARAQKKDVRIDIKESEGELGKEQEGLVIVHYGAQVAIQGIADGANSEIKRCHIRTNLGSLVTGDRVIWRDGEPMGVVVAVLPRHSALSRPDPHGDMKTIAANIDNILVVMAPLPRPHSFLVDRYLVAAEAINIKPVLVINKMDLIDADNRPIIQDFIDLYLGLGYDVIQASTTQGDGLNTLNAFLSDKTTILVGQSGVGKSSLINKLLPEQNLRVGALSASSQRGTHTTTTAQLFHLPTVKQAISPQQDNGRLIDSPGIREFGLWHMSEAEILHGFIELRPYIGQCRFRDCQHKKEPDCAILAAHRDGHIHPRRMSSYLSLRELIEGQK